MIEHLPRAEVIHLADASPNFTTMVRTVRFPIQAGRAPIRATICLADECIPAVEVLQPRRWLRSRRCCGRFTCKTVTRRTPILRIFLSSIFFRTSVRTSAGPLLIVLNAPSFRFRLALSQSIPLTAAWDVSGIDGNSKEETGVGDDEEEKKDSIYHKYANRLARARRVDAGGGGRSEEVVHCCYSSAWIRQQSRKP